MIRSDRPDTKALHNLTIATIVVAIVWFGFTIFSLACPTKLKAQEVPQSVATPLPVPYPGYWHPSTSALFYQCNVIPYLVYAQPDSGDATYVRADYQVMRLSGSADVPDGQGLGNHTWLYYSHDHRLIPIRPQVLNPGYWPAPTADMRNPGAPYPNDAGAYWAAQNPGKDPAPVSEASYSARVGNTAEWRDGNIPAFQLAKAQQCAITGPTRTPSPTVTPTPPCPACPPCPSATVTATLTSTRTVSPTRTPTPRPGTKTPTAHFGPA